MQLPFHRNKRKRNEEIMRHHLNSEKSSHKISSQYRKCWGVKYLASIVPCYYCGSCFCAT